MGFRERMQPDVLCIGTCAQPKEEAFAAPNPWSAPPSSGLMVPLSMGQSLLQGQSVSVKC